MDDVTEQEKAMLRLAMQSAMEAAFALDGLASDPRMADVPGDVALKAAANAIRANSIRQWPDAGRA